MKILDFKSVSPLFEMERDGDKPFTTRKIDQKDKRFRALSQWHLGENWGIRITNPATGESFVREIVVVSYLRYFDPRPDDYWKRQAAFYDWRIIVMGELVAPGVMG
jgi:hypothetical protein